MKFSLTTLFVLTAVIGFGVHVFEAVYGNGSRLGFCQLLCVFTLGSITTFCFSLLGKTLGGHRGTIVGAAIGCVAWCTMLLILHTFEGGISRIINIHLILVVCVALCTAWAVGTVEYLEDSEGEDHSISDLIEMKRDDE